MGMTLIMRSDVLILLSLDLHVLISCVTGLAFLEKKTGHNFSAEQNEKITDGARGLYEKQTGYVLTSSRLPTPLPPTLLSSIPTARCVL